jgi:Cdc6-like AAA superfamily ATPase
MADELESNLSAVQRATIESVYEALTKDVQVAVIVGGSGTGKTTVLRHVLTRVKSQFKALYTPSVRELVSVPEEVPPGSLVVLDDFHGDSIITVRQRLLDNMGSAIQRGIKFLIVCRRVPDWLVTEKWNIRRFELLTMSRPYHRTPDSIAVSLFIDPGAASEEALQELFESLSDFHLAAGGLGLEFKSDGNSVFCMSEVEQ